MKNSKKGAGKVWAIIFIAVIVVAGVYYFSNSNKSSSVGKYETKNIDAFSVVYPAYWTMSEEVHPTYSSYTFSSKDKSVSVLDVSDQNEIASIRESGPVGGGYDPSRTKVSEFSKNGLKFSKWEYAMVGDAGSGSRTKTVWVVIRSCNIDRAYIIDDEILAENFMLTDSQGRDSRSPQFAVCSY